MTTVNMELPLYRLILSCFILEWDKRVPLSLSSSSKSSVNVSACWLPADSINARAWLLVSTNFLWILSSLQCYQCIVKVDGHNILWRSRKSCVSQHCPQLGFRNLAILKSRWNAVRNPSRRPNYSWDCTLTDRSNSQVVPLKNSL